VVDARRRARRADGGGGAHRALKNMGIWRGNEPPGRDSGRVEGKVYRVHPVFTPDSPPARVTCSSLCITRAALSPPLMRARRGARAASLF